MLGKLIKYDIRATWRDFLGIYMAIILGVILLPLAVKTISNNLVVAAAGFLATAITIAVIAIMIINLFRIFNTNVFSKEGYLTMTLPVTSTQIVISKLLVSTMWIILTGIAAVIGLMLFLFIATPTEMSEIFQFLGEAWERMSGYAGQIIMTFILGILFAVTSATKEVAKLFLACSIAHLKQLSRFRIPVGILSYFVFSWIEVLLLQIIGFILNIVARPFYEQLTTWGEQLAHNFVPTDIWNLANGCIGASAFYNLLLTAAISVGIIWILKRKLDLD